MSCCKLIQNMFPVFPTSPRFDEPLPWPDLKTEYKELFRLDDKNPCCIIDISGKLTIDQWSDLDRIFDYAESNHLWCRQEFSHGYTHIPFSGLPMSYMIVSAYEFDFDYNGNLYLKKDGPPKKFRKKDGPIWEKEIIGLA